MAETAIKFGGGIITSKITYAAVALCVIFSALPFAAAAEIQNTNVNQNTSVTNAVTDKGLKIGSDGKYVVKLQKWLKNQGYYSGDIDGSFGRYTEEAVKFFQNDSDIIVDGWVFNQTVGAMEDLNGINIFEETSESSSSSTSSTNIKSTSTNETAEKITAKSSTDTTNADKNSTTTTKKSLTTTKKSTTTTKTSVSKTSTTSSATLSQILASGAKYGYSHAASTAAAMVSCGSGDCWAMSDYLYSKLSAAGINSRIVQYSTAYSSRHRSVQLYQGGKWVDVPYSSYGYSTMFKATSSKPGMTVIAS